MFDLDKIVSNISRFQKIEQKKRKEKGMKYLALSSKFTIHNLGDCGDFCSANEIAEEYMVDEPIWITTIDEWEKLAKAILKGKANERKRA